MEKVEQYRVFELEVPEGVTAVTFRQGGASAEVHTFSDGPARTLARFMPAEPGIWEYDGGSFLCTPASGNNHGPVRTEDKGFRPLATPGRTSRRNCGGKPWKACETVPSTKSGCACSPNPWSTA